MVRNWSLYNKEEKIRIDDLSAEQIHTILLAISSARMRDWYACQEGDLRWQNICDIAEFYEDTHQAKGDAYLAQPSSPEGSVEPKAATPAQPPRAAEPERRPLFEEAPDETNQSTLAMEAVNVRERRSARRYMRRLKFRTAGFEGETKDISMLGIALTQPLPPEIPKRFRAELVMNGQTLSLLCQRVDDRRLKIVDTEAWEILKQWIVSW